MSSVDFPYTAAAQSYVVPAGITAVLIEVWGGSCESQAVFGGYAARVLAVTPGETLNVYVGGSTATGFNGGGRSPIGSTGGGGIIYGAPFGAGATDVRQGGTALANRVLVAGGAAGAGSTSGSVPGAGGADVGGAGGPTGSGGAGGAQLAGGAGGIGYSGGGANGALGVGGDASGSGTGPGGGGYYGGGSGAIGYSGGGGSNFGGSLSNSRGVAAPDGSRNGYARVSSGSFTVTPDALNCPPRAVLKLIGSAGATVTVTRVDSTGTTVTVREADGATLVSGAWIGYDYEAPYNEAVTYTAVSDAGETHSASLAALREYGAQQGWLVHPGIPDLSVQLVGPVIGDESRDVLQGIHVVLGRADPVTITDGARKSPTFELTIKATTKDQDDAIKALLADTSTLLLQYVFPFTDLYDYYWVSVGQASRARMTNDYGEPYYRWTLPCTVTSAPSGLEQAQWSWADVAADYATWADVLSSYATWADVVTNSPVGS